MQPIVSKNKSQSQIAQCERALTVRTILSSHMRLVPVFPPLVRWASLNDDILTLDTKQKYILLMLDIT